MLEGVQRRAIKMIPSLRNLSYEGDGEERDRFWNDMDRSLDSVGNGYRLCILEDLN